MTDPHDSAAVTVLLVDDHAVVRSGMRAFFAVVDDIEVVGEAANGEAALDSLNELASGAGLPDVVLLDLVMPGADGTAVTSEIKGRYPEVEVVVLTNFGQTNRARAALEAGATGFLLKDAEADELAAAVRAARRGQTHLDPGVARGLTRSLLSPRSPAASLTAREHEVLVLVTQGCSNKDIAERLVISERTARTHVSHVLSKIGCSSRTQAAMWALREGLVHAPQG
ncbi:MAG: response regulator [Streptosporangiaceae bacterium]